MKLYLTSLLFLSCLSICFSAKAQDKIYKKTGEIIEAKVIEIGETEIKYKLFSDINGPTYSLDKLRIKQTIFENGRKETYSTNLKDETLYAQQAKNAIKINFLSPLNGYTQLNFEHSIKPGRSYELALGIIGLGRRQKSDVYYSVNNSQEYLYRNAAGAFVGAGYKFLSLPTLINSSDRYSHVLNGFYAKPEVLLGLYGQNNYSYNYTSSNSNTQIIKNKETVSFGAIIINVGKQWVLGDLLLIDLYAGVGYAADNLKDDSENFDLPRYHFGLVSSDSGVGFTGGIKLGILLNKKDK